MVISNGATRCATRAIAQIVFFLCAVAVLVACGGGGGSSEPAEGIGVTPINPANVTFSRHYDSTERVVVSYPSQWDREIPNLEPEILVFFLEPFENGSDQFRENVSVLKVPVGTPSTGGDVSNVRVISTRAASISGFSGDETIFDADVSGIGVSLRFMEIAVEFDGFAYALLYAGEREGFDRIRDIGRHIASSIDIGQVIFSDIASGSDLSAPGKPGIANDGTNFLVVTCRERSSFPFDTNLVGQFVPEDREIVAPELLLQNEVDTFNTGCRFTRPTVSFDGANYLVAYMTSHNGNRRIVGKRVTTDGQILDASPIDISQNDLGEAFEPITVFDGSRHMVVWQENFVDPVTRAETQQIRGGFVSSGGAAAVTFLIAPDLPRTQTFVYRPQIAIGDNQAMVIWEPRFESETMLLPRPLHGQIVDFSGNTLLPNPLLIRNDIGDNPRFSQVVSDGQQYVVAWIEGLLEISTIRAGQFGLYARAISQSGTLLNGTADDTGVEIVAENSTLPMEYLDLSIDAGELLFVWANATFGTDHGTYIVRTSSDLSAIMNIAAISGTQSAAPALTIPRSAHPEVSHTDTQTLVAWPAEDGFVEGWYLRQ